MLPTKHPLDNKPHKFYSENGPKMRQHKLNPIGQDIFNITIFTKIIQEQPQTSMNNPDQPI